MAKNHSSQLLTQRWVSYGLLALVFLLAYFHRMAPAVLATELQMAFEASGTALGVLGAAYFFTYTAMQIPSGVLADTLGARLVVSLGSLVTGVGAIAFGWSDTLAGAIVGRLLVGFGVSFVYLSTLKIISEWFPARQFATMTGLTVLIGNVGGLIATRPLELASELVSWRSIFVALGVVSMVIGALVYLLVRNRPQDIGLAPVREVTEHHKTLNFWQGARQVLKERQTWLGFFISMGQGGMVFTFMGLWVSPYLRDVHQMTSLKSYHFAVLLIGFAIGAVAIGFISDRMGQRKMPMLMAFVANLICWVPVIGGWQMSPFLSFPWMAVLGFTSAGYILTLSIAKECNPAHLSGLSTGIVNTGTFFGAVVFQPLVGWLMDLSGGTIQNGIKVYALAEYQLGMGLLGAAIFVGFICAFWSKETHCRAV